MRIGLASDSDGNLEGLGAALDLFVRAQVDRVFFLGGRFSDVDGALARAQGGGSGAAPVPATDLEFLAAVEGALARQAAAAAHPLAGRIVRVPSRACPEYGRADPRVLELVDGRICCLVHDKGALDRDDIANAAVVFHGNAPRAALVQIGPRCFVTPGPLRVAAPGGPAPTFALVDVSAAELALTVYSADGAELGGDRCPLGGAPRLTVR